MSGSQIDFFVRKRIVELVEKAGNNPSKDESVVINSELAGWAGPLLLEIQRLESERRSIRRFSQEIMPSTADRVYRSKTGSWYRRVDTSSLEFEEAGPPRKLVNQLRRKLLKLWESFGESEASGDD